MSATPTEIAEPVVKLLPALEDVRTRLTQTRSSKAKFGFAFDLLVDAVIQLGNLRWQTLVDRNLDGSNFCWSLRITISSERLLRYSQLKGTAACEQSSNKKWRQKWRRQITPGFGISSGPWDRFPLQTIGVLFGWARGRGGYDRDACLGASNLDFSSIRVD